MIQLSSMVPTGAGMFRWQSLQPAANGSRPELAAWNVGIVRQTKGE